MNTNSHFYQLLFSLLWYNTQEKNKFLSCRSYEFTMEGVIYIMILLVTNTSIIRCHQFYYFCQPNRSTQSLIFYLSLTCFDIMVFVWHQFCVIIGYVVMPTNFLLISLLSSGIKSLLFYFVRVTHICTMGSVFDP